MAAQTPLAIIGMACRLPGANDPSGLWDLLIHGRSAVGELPPQRLDDLYYDPAKGLVGKTYSKMGALCDYPPIDRARHPIPADLLDGCDLAHLTGCQVAMDACRDAGFDPLDLPHRNTGIFIGHTRGSELGGDLVYSTMIEQAAAHLREVDAIRRLPGDPCDAVVREVVSAIRGRLPHRREGGQPNTSSHMAAAVIAKSLGLNGPCIVLNAACSSSLQSILLARRALEREQIEMAIVGGTTYCKWDNFILYSHAQSISATGSRPFDDAADGLVPGDGFVMLLVKTLDRALADRNRILGVVRGIGVSSDGRGKSLWAPRKEGQVEAIRRAYSGDLDASRVQFVEAHATSTKVGDATEMAALIEAMEGRLPAGARVPVGSVKANIGHTLEAAGAASLVKVLLSMRHGLIPGQINCRRLNAHIDWQRAPFYVPTANLPWPRPADGHARRGAVNAFGIGGLNAHVVLDEPLETSPSPFPAAVAGSGPSLTAPRAHGGPRREEQPLAVVGAACLFAGARTLDAFWDLLASGRDPKCDAPPERWNTGLAFEPGARRPWRSPARRGGFITDFVYDWKRHKVPPVQVARANPLQFMVLDAVDAAFRDAECDIASLDRLRVGVLVGTQFGSDFANELQVTLRLPEFRRDLAAALRRRGVAESDIAAVADAYAQVLLVHMPALLDDSGSFSTSTLASRIAKVYDFMGGAMALDAGEASSLAAVWCAAAALRDRTCDLVVCVGGQRMMGLPVYEQMALAGELASDDPRAPFDASAAGRLPGEGVGVLLLKRLADAGSGSGRVRGVICGEGAGFDSSPAKAVGLAVRRAMVLAGVEAGDVALLETAGSGRPQRDREELDAVCEVYGAGPRRRPLLLGSASAQIGHTLGASGMASLLKAALSLERQRALAVFGLERPATIPSANGAVASPPAGGAPLDSGRDDGRLIAAVSSFDPAGGAFHVVLERPEPVPVQQEGPGRGTAAEEATVLRLVGTPYEMGLSHGRALAADIRGILQCSAELAGQPWAGLPDVSEAAAEPEVFLGREALEELRGIADGAEVSLADLIAHNLRIYPDMGSGCCHFILPPRTGSPAGLVHGANEDLPLGLSLRDRLTRHVQARFPAAGLAHVTFAVAGEVFGINGINCRGLAVTSAMLLDLPRRAATRRGLVQGAIVQKVLTEAGTVEEALGAIRRHTGTGAWGMFLSHGPSGETCYVEHDGSEVRAERRSAGRPALLAANHALLFKPLAEIPAHSRHRLARLQQLLGDTAPAGLGVAEAQAALRDRYDLGRGRATRFPTMNTVRRVDNQMSVVFQPAAGKLWVTRGPTAKDRDDQFVALDVADLLRGAVAQPPAPPSGPEPEAVCRRFVLRLLPAEPAPGGGPEPRLLGPAAIVGRNAVGRALREAIERRGGRAVELPVSAGAPDESLAELERVCQVGPVPHLFLVTPFDEDAVAGVDEPTWNRRREAGVVAPFFLCQRWYQRVSEAKQLGRASIIAVTALGGDFGFAGHDRSPESGALVGLIKAIRFEVHMAGETGFLALAVDAPAGGRPEAAASAALAELGRRGPDLEVGTVGERRYVVRPLPWPVEPGGGGPRGGVWLVTGGARGVTAVAAREMARRFGLRLHLIGSSPAPQVPSAWRGLSADGLRALRAEVTKEAIGRGEVPARAWKRVEKALEIDRNLRAFEETGVRAAYHACDLADRRAVAAVLQAVRRDDGPLEGILHGAGIEASCRFEKKTAEMLSQTVAAKVDGAAALMDLTRDDPLRYFIAFGSISGRFGNVGQTDYSLANEMLAKLVDWHRRARPSCRTAILQWHSWDEVGMAVRPESKLGKQMKGMRFMPTREGAEHLCNELAADLPEPEVLLTDYEYYSRFYPAPSADDLARAVREDPRTGASAPAVCSSAPETDREDVARRYVLRTRDAPLDPSVPAMPRWAGPVLVLGDNADAHALRDVLEQAGRVVHHLPVHRDPRSTLAELDWLWNERPAPHLFIMTGRDVEAARHGSRHEWSQRLDRGVMLPWLVCQRWLERVGSSPLADRATLAAAVSLGGDFGFLRPAPAPEGGAMTGLIKSLRHETTRTHWTGLTLKVIDAPRDEPPSALAAAILRELAAGPGEVEVAYDRGARRVARLVEEPVERLPCAEPARGGVWVVTGGARGITGAVALELGLRYGLRLHLLGSSEKPDDEAIRFDPTEQELEEMKRAATRRAIAEGTVPSKLWKPVQRNLELCRNFRRFSEAGLNYRYHRCDVGDLDQLGETLQRVRREDGPIEGILHGAGVPGAGTRWKAIQPGQVDRMLRVKVGAAMEMMLLTRDDPLRYFVGFGSVSGRFGANGDADYAMANDLLCKLTGWFRGRRGDCGSTGIHWCPWADLGMMTSSRSFGSTNLLKLKLMPPAEGTAHLIEELRRQAPENEILIADPRYSATFRGEDEGRQTADP